MNTFSMIALCAITISAICVVAIPAVIAIRKHRKSRRAIRQGELENELREAHLFGLRETLRKLDGIDVAKIALDLGLTAEEVEQKLNFPSLWKEFDEAGDDLIKLLAVGRKIREAGGVPAVGGLIDLWLDAMRRVVKNADARDLYGLLDAYRQSFPCLEFEYKVVATYCNTTQTCLDVAPFLHNEGRALCWASFNICVRSLAAECQNPYSINALLISIPVQRPGEPALALNTNLAIFIVLTRLWEIYRQGIESATEVAQLDDLTIPDLDAYGGFRLANNIQEELSRKKDLLLRSRVRQAAGLK